MEKSKETGNCSKVLIVDLSMGYGGSTSRVLTLLDRSNRSRIAVACLEGASLTKHARAMGLPLHVVGKTKWDPRILFRLIGLVRREGYQLLDSQNIQAKWWASLTAALTGAALVSTIHSWYGDEHGGSTLKGRLYTSLELSTNQPLDLYVTVSQQDRNRLLERGISEENIELIYNAVDLAGLGIESDPVWLRERFGLPADSIVCTAVGRLVWQKNHEMLVAAMNKAVKKVPQLICLIIGAGELKNELEAQIHSLELERNVLLAGYLDRAEVLKIIKSGDIYVMPSRYEGTPIALLEAAALERPIIATYAGGIPELVQDQEHALLFQPGDEDGVADALVRLCQDRGYASALAARGHQHVKQTFNLEGQVEATWNAYERAWARHHSRH